jgi:hypothetical protein
MLAATSSSAKHPNASSPIPTRAPRDNGAGRNRGEKMAGAARVMSAWDDPENSGDAAL